MVVERSPHYPAISLPEALRLLRLFDRTAAEGGLPPADAARALGFKAASGIARSRLGSLKMYGLLTKHDGLVRLTDLGRRLLAPANDEEYSRDLAEAARTPRLFGLYLDTPVTEALRDRLRQEHGFTDLGVKQFVRSLGATQSELLRAAPGAVEPVPAPGATEGTPTKLRTTKHVEIVLLTQQGRVVLQIFADGHELAAADVREIRRQLEDYEDRLRESSLVR